MDKELGNNAMTQQQLIDNKNKLIKALAALKVMVDKPIQEMLIKTSYK